MSELLHSKGGGMVRIDLNRAAYKVSGDFSKDIAKNIQYVSFEVSKRSMDSLREYNVTIGVAEKLTNIAQVNKLAQGDVLPQELIIETFDNDKSVISRRLFINLTFAYSSIGYALVGAQEKPVHKLVWSCNLKETMYNELLQE